MPACPDGLEYFREVISTATERGLLDRFTQLPLGPVIMRGRRAKRKMKCFDGNYDSTRRTVSAADPIPDYLLDVLRTSCECCGCDPDEFGQAIVTWYPPGYGIGQHTDAPVFGDKILGVSLATSAMMKFRREADCFHQALEPRSLVVMGGPSRWDWKHEVIGRSVKATRWSVTFRIAMKSVKPSRKWIDDS